MIEEATVDAYDLSEQVGGFFTMLENHLAVPFETTVLGLPVTVERLELTVSGQIVALCSKASLRQNISIVDLPLPACPPAGAEWIEAYRLWLKSNA
jgi:hypothetical protein